MQEDSKWHYICPKTDCPHVRDVGIYFEKGIIHKKCEKCGEDECWLCLSCGKTLCSRYKNGHARTHFSQTSHPIAVSFSDLSFWCYECNSYVVSPKLKGTFEFLHVDKFGKGTREVEEIFDSEKEVKAKAKMIAKLLKKSKHCVVYTGAGISTASQIPDYRGPTGVWTLKDQKVTAFCPISIDQAEPTFSHECVYKLFQKGIVKHVVSTNVDGLHMKSGIPLKDLSELHGNVFKEKCSKCGKLYYRSTDVSSKDDEEKITMKEFERFHKHYHGRKCEECGGCLIDTIVAFGESLPEEELTKANEHSKECDLSIIIGTKLSVTPACDLPFKGKKRNKKHKSVYINLQRSGKDHQVDIKVYEKVIKFLKKL